MTMYKRYLTQKYTTSPVFNNEFKHHSNLQGLPPLNRLIGQFGLSRPIIMLVDR